MKILKITLAMLVTIPCMSQNVNSEILKEVSVVDTLNSVNNATLRETSSLVTLKRKELNRETGLYLTDAINTNVPGVFMSRRTISAGQQFNIRGYGNGVRGTNGISSNFDGQGSKVYLNGILITDAEGITVMDDIDFSSLRQVDILKGPSGSLYGLAIAGVVNMETIKAPKNKISAKQTVQLGSFGLMRSTSQIAIGGKNSSFLVNYGKQKFDGYMPHTASHKEFVNVVGDFTLNSKQSVNSYFGYSDSYDERNGELTIQQYDTSDYSGNPAYIKNNAHSAVKTFRAGIGYNYMFNKYITNTTSFFGSSQKIDNSSAGGWTDKTPLSYGLRSEFKLSFTLAEKVKLSSITGLEVQQTDALSNGYRMSADSTDLSGYNVISAIRSIQSTSSATSSYFTQWKLHLPKEVFITAGLGISSMSLKLEDRLWGINNNTPSTTTPKQYEASYRNMLSPSFSIHKLIKEKISVYASYNKGYKAPVSSYFYIPTTGEINTGLKAEVGDQLELGSKGSLFSNKLYYSFALFNTIFSNKMTSVAVQNPQNTATLYSYIVNAGNLNNKGLEVVLKYELMDKKNKALKSLAPFVNLAYSKFTYENYTYQKIGKNNANQDSLLVFDYSGNAVAGVPPLVFNAGIDVNSKIGFYGNVTLSHRDAMYFTSDEVNQTEAYTLVNAKIGFDKEFNAWDVNVFFNINNLTNTKYYYMVFLNQLPDAYIPAPMGINYAGGVSLKYTF